MANTKISQLTLNTNPNGGEELVYAYNNTNGKMTLNTMKGYVENNLSWYVTDADLTTWLAWKQDTLVSWTNIKTINGSSILWSWNLVISWWWWSWEDNDYDAVVDASGNWDYTSISDAITAGIKRMYVRNWNYTMSSQTLSTWDFKLVWESKQWVNINIIYPTRSWTIFTMTSNTTDESHSFYISNATFNITYTWNYGYFTLFDIPDKWFLTLNDCNINVVEATNWCNFYLCDNSWQMDVNWCYIEINSLTWNPQWFWYIWMNEQSICRNSTIIVDAANSIATSWLEFWWNARWTYIWCIFKIWVIHNRPWDIVKLWASVWIDCKYSTSISSNIRIYWHNYSCTFPVIGSQANYDTALATAVNNNAITIWKPNTAYSVWQYVQSWYDSTIARCKTAHTSWTEYDSSKFDNVYWDVYIAGKLTNCNVNIAWTVVFSWIAQYSTAFTLPAIVQTSWLNIFYVAPQSNWLSNNIVILWYRWLSNNAIQEWIWYFGGFKILLAWECSDFSNNRIIAHKWSIYSSWNANMIANNIWTYDNNQTAPTATQVTWWGSTIDNNIFYWITDWD